MARRTIGTSSADPYDTDKEKRDLARARTAELEARTGQINQRQDNSYAQTRGYQDLKTMTEAENANEKRATNSRLTKAEDDRNKIEALKALHAAAAVTPGGEGHSKAALDALAKQAGVTVPKQAMDPKKAAQQSAMNKLRAAKGLPPLNSEEETQPAQPTATQAPQQDQSLFTPQAYGQDSGLVQQPQEAPREASLGNPITPHLGTGGAEVTPANPTGNKSDPWGPGGLFENNPTHLAAQEQQRQQTELYPTGPVSASRPTTFFPGEAQDRLAGAPQPQAPVRQLPPSPVAPNIDMTKYGPKPYTFDASQLVQPPAVGGATAGRTPQKVDIDLDAMFKGQLDQLKRRTNY